MGLLIHTSPKLLGVSGSLSKVLASGESTLAGCCQSMPWVKCYLHGVLGKAHNRIPRGPGDHPHVRVPIRSYVDDIT
eukprot:6361112-Pyramimonas_sp.AAC.1